MWFFTAYALIKIERNLEKKFVFKKNNTIKYSIYILQGGYH